jgi:hypothetical protein
MGQQQNARPNVPADIILTKRPDPGSRVQNDIASSVGHFDATRIAPINNMI